MLPEIAAGAPVLAENVAEGIEALDGDVAVFIEAGFIDVLGSIKSDERVILLALDHRTGQRGYVQLVVE